MFGWLLNDIPAPEERVPVVARAPTRALQRGVPFRVATWNVQFCGTRRQRFFYDGGTGVAVPAADQEWALARIGDTLAAIEPDLALLQEVDRDSARTDRADQLATLAGRLATPAFVTTPYHRSRFVPVPVPTPLGRVGMSLATLSTAPLHRGLRIALPPLAEPPWRQAFNLHRALLSAESTFGDGSVLAVANTHLSAFSRGDGTLPRQVEVLRAWMRAQRDAGRSWVLGGDLNLLPPGDDHERLGPDAAEYADPTPPLALLLEEFRSVIPPERLLAGESRTYLPPGAARPDRMLDYIFVSDDLEVVDARVHPLDPLVSDHWPLVATLRAPDR